MTRKRFVRQLMAVRIDRNHANMLADDIWRRGIPYSVAHRMMSPVLAFMKAFDVRGTSYVVKLTRADDEA